MAPPSKAQVKVATDALRTEAGIWDQQSSELGKIVNQANGLRLDRIEAGIFQIIFDAYASVADQVTARSGEGQKSMADVADTKTVSLAKAVWDKIVELLKGVAAPVYSSSTPSTGRTSEGWPAA